MDAPSQDTASASPSAAQKRPLRFSLFWRFRWFLILICLLLFVLLGVRAFRINSIPDVGAPFDVPAFMAADEIPPDQNAYRYYDQISEQLNSEKYRQPENPWRTLTQSKTIATAHQWSDILDAEQDAVRELIPLLDLLRQGAQMERGQQRPVKDVRLDTLLPFGQNLRGLVLASKADALRLESEGNLSAAWERLRDPILTCCHLNRGCEIEYMIAHACLKTLRSSIWDLLRDERTSPQLLRQIIRDLQQARRRIPPPSHAVKYGYCLVQNSLAELDQNFDKFDHPAIFNIGMPTQKYVRRWILVGLRVIGEPLRIERTARQICANRLAVIDLPRAERHSRISTTSPANAPLAVPPQGNTKALTPAQLDGILRSELIGINSAWYLLCLDNRDEDQVFFNSLILTTALEIHRRETGHYPEKLAELSPKNLDTLPEDPTLGHGQPFQYRRVKDDECHLWTSIGYDPAAPMPAELKKAQQDFELYGDGGLTCILRPAKAAASAPAK